MLSINHFEELWESAETLQKEDISDQSSIVNELIAKLSIYKGLSENQEIPNEERQKLKTHLMGKILLTFTNLSLKDNINTFTALHNAVNELKIDLLEKRMKH